MSKKFLMLSITGQQSCPLDNEAQLQEKEDKKSMTCNRGIKVDRERKVRERNKWRERMSFLKN